MAYKTGHILFQESTHMWGEKNDCVWEQDQQKCTWSMEWDQLERKSTVYIDHITRHMERAQWTNCEYLLKIQNQSEWKSVCGLIVEHGARPTIEVRKKTYTNHVTRLMERAQARWTSREYCIPPNSTCLVLSWHSCIPPVMNICRKLMS